MIDPDPRNWLMHCPPYRPALVRVKLRAWVEWAIDASTRPPDELPGFWEVGWEWTCRQCESLLTTGRLISTEDRKPCQPN